jgi:DNA-binding response OmpR family regulator
MPRALLIDDDIELTELATEFLTLEGFDVEVARRGDNGLERALAGGFDAIILDVMLPGLGGFEVLRRLRAPERRSGSDADRARRRRRPHSRTGKRRRRLPAQTI